MPVKVHVENFQSLKDASVEIDRLTVVTGGNNSGKTALQRAVRGVFQNTGGTAFIREGEKQCKVTLDFGDRKVSWSKGTGKRDRPTYILDDGEPIYPGSSVPEEVAALGVTPIRAGGEDIWPTIAPQFTGQVFLLDRPGSALAEAVADVERVGQLNRALRAAEGDRRNVAATLKVRQSDLVKYEQEVEFFDGLDPVLAEVEQLAVQREKVARVGRAVEGLHDLRSRLQRAVAEVERLGPVDTVTVPTPDALLKMQAELTALKSLRERHQKALAEESRYAGAADLSVDASTHKIERIEAARAVLTSLRDGLRVADQRVQDRTKELNAAQEDLREAEVEAAKALAELGQCPVCGAAPATAP